MPPKEYDLIVIGTGSVMQLVGAMIQQKSDLRVAVIDKDEPGGICLTRGCIPSKLIIYPAELVRLIQRAREFGIDAPFRSVDFGAVMHRMRSIIDDDIAGIREGLTHTPNLDYFPTPAEFVEPYTLSVSGTTIHAPKMLLGLGSATVVPPIPGLQQAGFLTSDSLLHLTHRPESVAIIGGGYIAAEYSHFLSAMGTRVTIVGRNPQFLPHEEPEISSTAMRSLSRHLTLLTNREAIQVENTPMGKRLTVRDRSTGTTETVTAEEILVAAGRGPTTATLHPERAGIAIDNEGWVVVNEYLETSQKNVWALGDATGRFLFKHKANFDARVLYQNLVRGQRNKVDYHAVPHAIFTEPEIAGVGLGEAEAIRQLGAERIRIGFYRYADTAKGQAIGESEGFVKILLDREEQRILGAHIVGPQAAVLIQEVVNLMYTVDRSPAPIWEGMHIHPALSEVVERAFGQFNTVQDYHHQLTHLLSGS
jgi:dihydrolipoamide dehydrogenase